MKKLLLVSANQYTVPYPVYPLGLAYIKTYLESKLDNFEIRLFDFVGKNENDFIQYLQEYRPEYVGVSFRNIDDVNIYKKESFIFHYRKIIENIRKYSHSKIVVGGPGFSIYPKFLFEFVKPDFGIYGEGEESFHHLLMALENNTDYTIIEGLVFPTEKGTQVNPRTTFFNNLDLSFVNEPTDFYWKESGMLNIQTKRGCPYKCIYCTYPVIEGRKIRTLDTDKIVDTLKNLYFNKKIDYVFFTDSVFNMCNDYNHELADKIINSGIDIKWGGYFNFALLDEKLLVKLKKAGLTHIEFGTESISDTTLKNYNKPFTVAEIIEASALCNRLDIDFAHFLILGGYGETDETINETFENSKKINRSVFFPFVGMRIYPGTHLHQIAIDENKIDLSDDLLEPKFYISDKINLDTLKERAKASGRTWIFPDEDMSAIMDKMRKKNKKGPLWEYLI